MAEHSIFVTFKDNRLLPLLFGDQDEHLQRIEKSLRVGTSCRGNTLSISGEEANVNKAETIVNSLYKSLEKGYDVGPDEVDAALRMVNDSTPRKKAAATDLLGQDAPIKTKKKHIVPFSPNQKHYVKTLMEKDMVFASGPAGTGKTYLAVAVAVHMWLNQKVERIILCRPAVEAGEKLGFLPGDMKEKVDPYFRPLYDALFDMIPTEQVTKMIEEGTIEIAPLAFMRGRTLTNAYIILDEAQNATSTQMKMFLTRLGRGARMVIAGDLSQTDLPNNVKSGLRDAVEKLKNIEEIGMVRFDEADVVRNPLTAKIVQAYELYKDKHKHDYHHHHHYERHHSE